MRIEILSASSVITALALFWLCIPERIDASEDVSPIQYRMWCVEEFCGPGQVNLRFHMWWHSLTSDHPLYHEEFELIAAPSEGVGYSGLKHMEHSFDEDGHFWHTFELNVPDQDTTYFEGWVRGPSGAQFRIGPVYFVTTSDTAEFWVGRPRKRTRVEPDTTRYRVEMDLRDSVWFEGAKKYAERQGTKLVPSDSEGFYILRLPLNEVRALGGDGLNFRILDSLPPDDGSQASPHKGGLSAPGD